MMSFELFDKLEFVFRYVAAAVEMRTCSRQVILSGDFL